VHDFICRVEAGQLREVALPERADSSEVAQLARPRVAANRVEAVLGFATIGTRAMGPALRSL
jgi:hypothetical protein